MYNNAPDTNGSQFFIVYKDSPMPAQYTIIGTVTTGLDVLDKIAAGGTQDGSGSGKPKTGVTIQTLTVTTPTSPSPSPAATASSSAAASSPSSTPQS
jgi:peptidyl-prolyl cis-trans isomerase B (cyclophilin B)